MRGSARSGPRHKAKERRLRAFCRLQGPARRRSYLRPRANDGFGPIFAARRRPGAFLRGEKEEMSAHACFDPVNGHRYPLDVPRWRSDEGRPLLVTHQRGISRKDIDRGERSLWRYRAALPVKIRRPVSLGEGMTPLVERAWDGLRPHVKLEWFNPTSSFKDRGASVMLSYLRQLGVAAVLEDSSGNGGAAVAIRQSPEIFYSSHNWQPLFLQATKSIAYEIWEDCGFVAPDNIIMPVGAGSLLLGCCLGFEELPPPGRSSRRRGSMRRSRSIARRLTRVFRPARMPRWRGPSPGRSPRGRRSKSRCVLAR